MALFDQVFLPAPLTVNELAAQDELSPIEINKLIKQARIELFGKDLSRSAIYYRLKHQQQRRNRTCAEPDCENPIRSQEPISRLYCDTHNTPSARTRRHRRTQTERASH
jgi:hypothetical protein